MASDLGSVRNRTFGRWPTTYHRVVPHSSPAIAASLFALLGATCVGCTSADAGPLSGETWVLTSATEEGASVEVGDNTDIRWRFIDSGGCDDSLEGCPSGPKLTGSNDFCNDFARSIRVQDAEVVWGDYWQTTLAACGGGVADTLSRFFADDSFRYVLSDDQLDLTSSDGSVALTFAAG